MKGPSQSHEFAADLGGAVLSEGVKRCRNPAMHRWASCAVHFGARTDPRPAEHLAHTVPDSTRPNADGSLTAHPVVVTRRDSRLRRKFVRHSRNTSRSIASLNFRGVSATALQAPRPGVPCCDGTPPDSVVIPRTPHRVRYLHASTNSRQSDFIGWHCFSPIRWRGPHAPQMSALRVRSRSVPISLD